MRNEKNIPEKIFSFIALIFWLFIWKPISLTFGYLFKLFSEVMASVHKRLVSWLSYIGFGLILSLIAYFLHFSK